LASRIFEIFSPFVDVLPERVRIYALYLYKLRKFPRIGSPKTFNEKVQWRKLYDRPPIFNILADKLAVKDYVYSKRTPVLVPKVLWEGDTLKDIDFDEIPENYVIKANHASGTNYIVKGQRPSIKKLDTLEDEWRDIDVSKTFVEWAYSEIPIKFFVEEFLDIAESVPVDYKFWVFHGKVKFVQVDVDRFIDHKRAFFSKYFEKLPFLLTLPDIDREIKPPENFNEMVSIAESLADGLDFVRVDLYSDENKVYFGECTMYPGGGYEEFKPKSKDLEIGSLWCLDQSIGPKSGA
jgi:hypothetical protein